MKPLSSLTADCPQQRARNGSKSCLKPRQLLMALRFCLTYSFLGKFSAAVFAASRWKLRDSAFIGFSPGEGADFME